MLHCMLVAVVLCVRFPMAHRETTPSSAIPKQHDQSNFLQTNLNKNLAGATLWETLQAEVSAGSNLVDIFGSLPVVEGEAGKIGQAKRVAICATGHVRTFVLQGLYSGIKENLLDTNPGKVDVYFIGHAGADGADGAREKLADFIKAHADNINDPSDPGLKEALDFFGEALKHHEVHPDGSCADLERAWEKDGITDRQCKDDGNFLQMAWLDHCVRTVQKREEQYDILVRTRPDVGVFEPVDWNKISTSQVNYMQKDAGGRADWFFTIPTSAIDAYWKPVSEMYLGGATSLPDYTIFNGNFEKDAEGKYLIEETAFPAAIVRGSNAVDCFRLVGQGMSFASECKQKESEGYFGKLHM